MEHSQPAIICSKLVRYMFKVNNKDAISIVLMSLLTLKNFTSCSTVSTVTFEQVNTGVL